MTTINNPSHFMRTLIFINVLIILPLHLITPLWGAYVAYLGGDIRAAGTAICLFTIVIGIVTCFAAKLESQIGREEWFLVGSSAWMTLSYLGYFFIHHPWQLYLLQISFGLAGAFQAPAIYALYHRFLPKKGSAFYWGIWAGFYNIAYGLGALGGAYLLHHASFNAVFTTMFLFSLVGLVIEMALAKEINHR